MSETYTIQIGGGVTPEVLESLKQLKAGVNGTESALSQLGTRLAAVFSVYKIVEFGKNAINAADELNKFSQEVGIGVEKLSAWKYSADLSGVGDKFRAGMIKFSNAIEESSDRSSKAARMFEIMGIKIHEVGGKVKPTEKILDEFADKISSYADGQNKLALVEAAFGTKHARFVAMLNGGSAGLKQQAEDLKAIGGGITAEDAARAEAFNDSLTRLKAGIQGLAIKITGSFLPSIEGLVKALTDKGLGNGGLHPALKLVTETIKYFSIGVVEAYGILEVFGTAIGQTAAAAWEAAHGHFSQAGGIMKQLGKDLDELQAKREAAINKLRSPIPALVEATARTKGGKADAPSISGNKQAGIDELDTIKDLVRYHLQELELKKEMVKVSYELTDVEKRDRELEILKEENRYIADQIELLQRKRAATADEATKKKIDNEIDSLGNRAAGVRQRQAGIEGQADPRSIRQQMRAAMTDLRNGFGTVAQQIAQGFKTVVGGAIQSISNGITGLIMRTKTWKQALMEIGTSILTSIVQAIVEMGVKWIATQILMAVAGKAIQASATAATAPIAAAQAAIWATPATLATIASYGTAAELAPAFIVAAQAAVAGISAGGAAGFYAGGYTGDGNPRESAGIVHGREFVLNAPATAEYRPILEAMNRREVKLGGGGGSPRGGGKQQAVQVSFINDRQDEREFQARDGWKITADKLRRRGVKGA